MSRKISLAIAALALCALAACGGGGADAADPMDSMTGFQRIEYQVNAFCAPHGRVFGHTSLPKDDPLYPPQINPADDPNVYYVAHIFCVDGTRTVKVFFQANGYEYRL